MIDCDKGSSLRRSARLGNIDKVTAYLEGEVDVDSRDLLNGYTALHEACFSCNEEVVSLLLKREANVNVKTFAGWSAVMIASFFGHAGILSLLLDYSYEANINMKDNSGAAALHMACFYGEETCVALLIRHAAQVDVKNSKGQTPLDIARQKGLLSIVKLIYHHSPSLRDTNNRLPLHNVLLDHKWTWNEGICSLVTLYEEGISIKDERSGLYPFLLASVEEGDLDTGYELLRRAPYLLYV